MKKRVLLLVLAVLALTFALVSCGHEHDFKQTSVITEATCEAAGKAVFACDCGEQEEREIAALPHAYGEEIVQAPTCRHDGYTYQVCSVCGTESEHTDVIKSGADYHDFSATKMTTPVDCGKQQNGIKETVCSVCGQTDPDGTPEFIRWAHDYEEVKVEATCKAPGSITQVCKTCDARGKVDPIAQLPHTEVQTGSSPATCLTEGVDNYKCTVCDETWTVKTADALGHNWDTENVQYIDPTCTLPGYDYYECSNAGCTDKNILPGQHGDALKHEFDYDNADYTIVVNPTCITEGSITPKCMRPECGEILDTEINPDTEKSYIKAIPATGIHYVTDKSIGSKAATCHEAAYEEFQCTTDAACTATEKRHSGEKLVHVYPETPTAVIEAKCYAYGYDLYVCTICPNEVTADSERTCDCFKEDNVKEIPHKATTNKTVGGVEDENGVAYIPSTCMKNAYTIWECGDCNTEWRQTYTEDEKPLLKHGEGANGEDTWVQTQDVVNPTCTSEGYTYYVCTNDGDCVERCKKDYTRRTEHPFTEYIDGRLVCNVCDVTYRDVTTYIDKAVDSGKLPIDGETELDWELKGYENPDEPTALEAGVAFEYVIGEDDLSITNGIIKLESDANATYTIVVTCGETSKTYEVSSANVFFDLYVNGVDEQNGISGEVTKVTITATAAATVSFYAYEG